MTSPFPNFHQAPIAVIGDIMLDHYLYGSVARISPEAPVPVVKSLREEYLPGGAANVAVNLAALGASVSLSGLVGADAGAEQLHTRLQSIGVNCAFNHKGGKTIVKSRVMGGSQQLLRIDHEEAFSREHWSATWAGAKQTLDSAKVIVLSDYHKGTLVDCQAVIAEAKQRALPVLVDPKGRDFRQYRGASLLTPNLAEYLAIVGEVNSEAELAAKAQDLIRDLQLGALLVTRSEKGMSLFRPGQADYHLPAITKAVADVTGAGDTVIATIAASLAAGARLETAVTLANIAASIVVAKVGTSSVTAPELALQYHKHHHHGGLLSAEQLLLAVELAKARGEKIVFTNGCFDILHAGHVSYLRQARSLGDRLIVAINSDASVSKLKGPGRPINTLERRMAVLAGLESVDWVSYFEGDTPEALLQQLQPDILVKGGDYSEDQVVGRAIVKAYGGEVKVMSLVEGCSTTDIVNKLQ